MTQEVFDASIVVFYRIVKTNPPTVEDFRSGKALGKTLIDPDLDNRRLWEGISVYATEAQARRTARRYPRIGSYIVALRVSQAGPTRWDRTTGRAGHYTFWGEAGDIMTCVVSILSIAQVEQG
jgi:hypothetical protein